ncbi:hypothetical protein RB653_006218 [Dictyostelium firmibasis]|uniref:Uncharacterized protein n=1 Tax=Dictyostelium firmibasis TaxID=79012 RepID=A0AAN7U2J6_9MYCE
MKFLKVLLLILCITNFVKSESKILKNYVEKKDPNYKWNLNATYDTNFNSKIYILELTSQQWMKDHSNDSIWKHWLTICVPNDYDSTLKIGHLHIIDGMNQNWTTPALQSLSPFSMDICNQTSAITSTLYQVPNQFITFENDGIPRQEDDIVAYTWRKYIDSKVSDWVSLLPQTKAGTAAMTAIQEFGKQKSFYNIEKFVVSGASKRGWTTYGLAMIGEKRLAAAVPMVIGVPNLVKDIKEQMISFGNWSWALNSYINQGIPSFFDTEYFKVVTDIVDPINYLDVMESIPKFIILTVHDEFFVPDSTKFYYNQIKGEKRLALFQTNHGVSTFKGVSTEVSKYFKLISKNQQRPELTWNIVYSSDNNSGTINMKVIKGGTPSKVVVYSVNTFSKTKRDFRMFTCFSDSCYQNFTGSWQTHSIDLTSNNSYSFTISKPINGGWTAFYFDVEFKNSNGENIANVNTELAIVPNLYPFPPCTKEVCGSGVPEWVPNSSNTLSINNFLILIMISIIFTLLF